MRILAVLEAATVTGPAKNLLEFARWSKSGGIDLTIVTFRRGAVAKDDAFLAAAERVGARVEIVSERSAFDLRTVAGLRAVVDRLQPDVVQTHAMKSHFLGRLAGFGNATPWVAFHHGYTFDDTRVLFYNALDHWSLRKPQAVVTVSLPFIGQLEGKGVRRERISVLHNAIDPKWGERVRAAELRSATRQKLGLAADEQAVLIVGRLSKEKSHLGLLEALRSVRDAGLGKTKLLVVGRGPAQPVIEERLRALKLEQQVVMVGQVSDVAPYYAAADVAVLASVTEGSPNALLEAMAARLPVVATAVGGIPEIVTSEQSALLVPASDTPALASALRRMLSDAGLRERLAGEALRVVLERHSPDSRARALVAIYEKVRGKAAR